MYICIYVQVSYEREATFAGGYQIVFCYRQAVKNESPLQIFQRVISFHEFLILL